MVDVIDEDLMRELGLDENDIKDIENKKNAPASEPVAKPTSAVSETSKKPAAPAQNPRPAATPPEKKAMDLSEANESLAKDVPVQLAAVLAKKTMTLGQVLSLRVGEVLELGHKPADTIDLVAGGKLIAKAELVMIDGQMGVRLVKLIR